MNYNLALHFRATLNLTKLFAFTFEIIKIIQTVNEDIYS